MWLACVQQNSIEPVQHRCAIWRSRCATWYWSWQTRCHQDSIPSPIDMPVNNTMPCLSFKNNISVCNCTFSLCLRMLTRQHALLLVYLPRQCRDPYSSNKRTVSWSKKCALHEGKFVVRGTVLNKSKRLSRGIHYWTVQRPAWNNVDLLREMLFKWFFFWSLDRCLTRNNGTNFSG